MELKNAFRLEKRSQTQGFLSVLLRRQIFPWTGCSHGRSTVSDHSSRSLNDLLQLLDDHSNDHEWKHVVHWITW